MSTKCYAILRDNKFYFKTSESSNLKEFRFDNIKNYPNVPFYINFQ